MDYCEVGVRMLYLALMDVYSRPSSGVFLNSLFVKPTRTEKKGWSRRTIEIIRKSYAKYRGYIFSMAI